VGPRRRSRLSKIFQRNKAIDLRTPLYQARVASLVRESRDLDSNAAEGLFDLLLELLEKDNA
jgi:hypothetical protein